MWQSICDRLSQKLGVSVEYLNNNTVSGGCIHNAQRLKTSAGTFFVKTNRANLLAMFEAEAAGLTAIRNTGTIRCPKVLFADIIAGDAVLVMEFISMQPAQPGSMDKLGRCLAALHQNKGESFGWHRNNNIGLTPQQNDSDNTWLSFFRKQRLEFQFQLCEQKGLHCAGKQQLLENLAAFFGNHDPKPSLLHGDLWGGNVGFDANGEPVLFDPACYFGDREADLAFTEMFGGFSPEFYTSYNEKLPLDAGYSARKRLYNLYHELNHYYLFGGGYGSQAKETIRFLLSLL